MIGTPELPFPCPFCRSSRVALIGGGLAFLHYQCAECSEVWTAMADSCPESRHRRLAPEPVTLAMPLAPPPKVWRH